MQKLIQTLSAILPQQQIITDPLRRLAYGTDASFYRLIPELIVVLESESDLLCVLQQARKHQHSVTFRAAGTSLSGQAISDSILALIGDGFASCAIGPDGMTVKVGPGMIGAAVNRELAPWGRKIGPDPASINTCKIGGIAANNASGMCCGTSQNSYRTLAGMRVILADGCVLDTEDPVSVAEFARSHAALLDGLSRLGQQTRLDTALAARIRHKFKIKNTTGYSLNALVDFEDPVEILAHLMIGSEGTLGFISSISYHTVADDPCKASALVFFEHIEFACQAVMRLKPEPVSAVELLDRAALRSVQNKPGLPALIKTLDSTACALLIEVRAETAQLLQQRIDRSLLAMSGITTIETASFSSDPATCEMYWNVRKGTFPSVGAMRRTGTTVIIEDVAFPVEVLAAATLDLQALLQQHGYNEAIIFGHALEGNLHFVFTQDFGLSAEVERYARLMDDLCELVLVKYDGSLKAEHGTGRNMAPFVEMEWGKQATDLMRSIKNLFDPDHILNSGVILTDDPGAHLKHLKPMPAAEDIVDRCIECGFCEPLCPSHGLTLSPRQRIVSWRELARRVSVGQQTSDLDADFAYMGMDTCAGCGLCATACPVGIDTGELIRRLRGRKLGPLSRKTGRWASTHFGQVVSGARLGLSTGHVTAALVGEDLLSRLSGNAWKRGMPQAGRTTPLRSTQGDPVVYFPTCGPRIFGANSAGELTQQEVILTLLERAGYAVRLPEGDQKLCCGQMLASKGMEQEADAMAETLTNALKLAADDGQGGYYPVFMDASACSVRMQKRLAGALNVLDFHEFAHDALLPRLMIKKQQQPIALHVNCSVRRSGSDAKLQRLVEACAEQVVVPHEVGCCGFGGERGFAVPELNAHALRKIHVALPSSCCFGVSTNRTCEIGLTSETGRPYRSVAYLLEECTRDENNEVL